MRGPLAHCVRQAANYRIKPSARGFTLWRFRDWDKRNSGWRVLSTHRTREDAEQALLERLDLEPAKPAPKVVYATLSYVVDLGDMWGWG